MSDGTIGAGWYYAQGDPPGTHRYWDGQTWIGAPQPVMLGASSGGTVASAVGELASWGRRVVALIIDAIVMGLISFALVVPGLILAGDLDDPNAPLPGALWFGLVVALLVNVAYYGIFQGKSGQTLGKKAMGIYVVDMTAGAPIGIGRGIGRYLITIVLANLCFFYTILDYLWPVWDQRNQRLTDKMMSSVVAMNRADEAASAEAFYR